MRSGDWKYRALVERTSVQLISDSGELINTTIKLICSPSIDRKQMSAATPPIALPLASLVPPPELFTHASTLHGQAHVSRVMVHAFRLIAATGWADEASRLWAAVYLHDIARTHHGRCHRHGGDAMTRFETLSQVHDLFAQGGVAESDYPAICTAVVHHCVPEELERTHPHMAADTLLKVPTASIACAWVTWIPDICAIAKRTIWWPLPRRFLLRQMA